jgi:hypothetical protein
MKVSRSGERLSDDARANHFAAALDHLPVGFVAEQQLRQARHCQRVDHA